jgi:hypothetical protein
MVYGRHVRLARGMWGGQRWRVMLLAVCIGATAVTVPSIIVKQHQQRPWSPTPNSDPPGAAAPATKGTIQATWLLRKGESVRTTRTRIVMQTDGDLVIADEHNVARWRSGTAGRGDLVVFQNDGHLVVYDNSMHPWWQSGTAGHFGAVLVLQADGDVCIIDQGTVIWRTGTAH